MEFSKTNISFLETMVSGMVYCKNQLLLTDLYTKPTDSHNYLLEICKHFTRREYPTEVLAKGLLRAASHSRDTLLSEAAKKKQ